MIPEMQFGLLVPEILLKSARIHNKFCKEILSDLMAEHHRDRIPGHFQVTAVRKYGYDRRISTYYPRKPNGNLHSYDEWKMKRYRSDRPLVKTGRSEALITTQYRITCGGNGGDGFTAKLHMRFPFGGGTGARKAGNLRGGATPDVLVDEVARTTPQEREQMSRELGKRYAARVMSDTSPRQRIKT